MNQDFRTSGGESDRRYRQNARNVVRFLLVLTCPNMWSVIRFNAAIRCRTP